MSVRLTDGAGFGTAASPGITVSLVRMAVMSILP